MSDKNVKTDPESEQRPERKEYERLDELTDDARARVTRLKDLAAESRDLWEQVGQDIADMRALSPRHAVARLQWLKDIGLDGYARPAQISGIVKWGADREVIEKTISVPEFAATAPSIMAAYWKKAPKRDETPDADDYMFEQALPENPYSAADLGFVHGSQLDRSVSARMRDAKRQGADELGAAQFAFSMAQAEVARAHAAMVTAMRRKETEGLPDDPDADF